MLRGPSKVNKPEYLLHLCGIFQGRNQQIEAEKTPRSHETKFGLQQTTRRHIIEEWISYEY
jgi:hypothetical protein